MKMTRNVILLLLGVFLPASSFATADSPVVQGLGGGGRAGIPSEALFSNPAAVGLLSQSYSFLMYEKPKIPEWNAGGRAYSVGAYDGTNEAVRGAFGYLRTSRARVDAAGQQGYEDRSEYRLALGRPVWSSVVMGLQARYVTKRTGPEETSFFDGSVGAIFPVYAGFTGGLTYENFMNKEAERPPTVGAGLTYNLGYGLQAYGDGTRIMKGPSSGQRGWSLGAEFALAGDFRLRGGKFQDGYRRRKGWSVGISWAGPRASFDYAMRTSGADPKERDHIFGMTVAL
jgi:hypothetical protein